MSNKTYVVKLVDCLQGPGGVEKDAGNVLASLKVWYGAVAQEASKSDAWTADVAVGQLEAAGWVIHEVREDHKAMWFSDIAALIGYVRTAPWAFEDLDWTSAEPRLRQLHVQSEPIDAVSHRFLMLATG